MTTALTATAVRRLQQPLQQVCARIGADASSAELIKYTMNAVFRVWPFVIRLAHGPHAATLSERIHRVAVAFEQAQVPMVRVATDIVDGPVYAGDWVGTVWRYVATVDVVPEPVDLALPLDAIHNLGPVDVELPQWDPIAKFRRRINSARRLPAAEYADLDAWASPALEIGAGELLDLLERWCDDAEADLQAVKWKFPTGPTHGDAHTGNLLLRSFPVRPGPDPEALLCDPDGVCIGHREWDWAATAHGVTRFGRDRIAYDRLADAVGFDVTGWSGWPALARIRELQSVTSTIDALTGRPAVADELARRIRSLQTGDTSVVWTRYH